MPDSTIGGTGQDSGTAETTRRSTLGRVINFPLEASVGLGESAINGASSVLGRLGAPEIGRPGHLDDWGRDPRLFSIVTGLSQLRWDVSTGGTDRLPKRKGALIVCNTRRFSMAPVFTAFGISRSTGRTVRFVGRPDRDPLGPFAQRLGAIVEHPDEVAGALAADELVVMPAAPSVRTRRVGTVDHFLIGAALEVGVRIHPAATTSSPFGRRARVEVGPATRARQRRRGPLAELEFADHVRDDIVRLLDEMGDIDTGTPLDWLPFSRLGEN